MLSKTTNKIILAALLLAMSQVVSSAALETEDYTIDIFPSSPTTSDIVFLSIESRHCVPGTPLNPNGVVIDHIQKQVSISVYVGGNISFLGCFPPTKRDMLISRFSYPSAYDAFIYNEPDTLNDELHFNQESLIGVIQFNVGESNSTHNPEVPAEGSIQSGVGMVRGWACDAFSIEVSFDDGERIPVAYGTSREDTRESCGDANNGYGMVIAWGLLGEGTHRMQTFKNGIEVSDIEFEVSGLGEEFATGLSGTYVLQDFPAPGESVTVEWSEPHQNFIIVDHN